MPLLSIGSSENSSTALIAREEGQNFPFFLGVTCQHTELHSGAVSQKGGVCFRHPLHGCESTSSHLPRCAGVPIYPVLFLVLLTHACSSPRDVEWMLIVSITRDPCNSFSADLEIRGRSL